MVGIHRARLVPRGASRLEVVGESGESPSGLEPKGGCDSAKDPHGGLGRMMNPSESNPGRMEKVPPEQGLGEDGVTSSRAAKRELLRQCRESWEAGEPIPVEQLLQRWPEDPAENQDVASLLLEDFLQRTRRVERVSSEHYQERFPDQADSLA